jgi:drug/metabolite transporter (DMT)-like permease
LTLILSLCAAIAYGVSDFVGGVAARRANVWSVASTSQTTAALLIVALAFTNLGMPTRGDLVWGALAGIGSGTGTVFIYRGLARGRMAVVAPLSAITAAALPVLAGVAGGERPRALAMIGVLIALPAIWLVSASGEHVERATRADLRDGLLAGLGFGILFAALGQVPERAGLTPLAVSQVVSAVTIAVGAIAQTSRWIQLDRGSSLGTVAGLLAFVGTLCFQLATQRGLLSIAGVVASLYPAFTVLLAALVLRETIHRRQAAGLALAAASIALIASG